MKRPWKVIAPLLLAAVSAFFLMFTHLPTATAAAPTDVPNTISFQGKVVYGTAGSGPLNTNLPDGTYPITFKLYTVSTGGTAVWGETQTSVSVVAGVFQVNLGSTCSLFVTQTCSTFTNTAIDFSTSPTLYLGITFNNDVAGEMTPRVQMQSVPYAFYANTAGKLGGLTASQFVQLSPGTAQSGFVNLTGNGTFSGTLQGVTVTATGALQGNSLNVASGAFAVDNTGDITASTGLTTTGNATIQQASYTSNLLLVNDGQLTAPPAYPNSYLPAFSVVTSQTSGSRPLFFGYNAGTGYAAFLTSGACGAFTQMCLDLGNGATALTALENVGTQLKVGGGDDGNFSSLALLPGGGTTTIGTSTTIDSNGQIFGKGFDYFDPSLMTGATSVGSGGDVAGNLGGVFSAGAFIDNQDAYTQEFVASLASATTNNRNVGDSTNWYFNNGGNVSVTSSDISTTGGYFRISTGTTTTRAGLLAFGATAGTLDKPLNATNLPIIQEKVRPSILRTTDDFFWGAFDTPATATATNDFLPTNGFIFATNNSTGATGWTGIVRKAGVSTTVTCPGGISTNFATGRIVIVNSTTARFFIDTDATDGVSFVDCGNVTVAAGLPTVDMSFGMHVAHTTNTTSNFDMDYARWWQDDAPTSSSVQANEAQADLATEDIMSSDSLTAPANATSDVSSDSAGDVGAAIESANSDPVTSTDISSNEVTIKDNRLQIVDSSGKTVASIDDAGNVNFDGDLNVNNATLSGGLTVGGDSTFSGLSTFQKLATFIAKVVFRQNVDFEGHITTASDTAGYAKLQPDETSVHVTFKTPYDSVPIVTVNSNAGNFAPVAATNVTTTGFDIVVSQPVTEPTTFSWIALGTHDPQTATNPPPATSH